MKKKLHHHFIDHLRSYRTFHFMIFTFVLLITSIGIYSFGSKSYAGDLLEEAFKPAMTHETIIDLGKTKNAVGNEVLRESIGVQDDLGYGCFINNGSTKIAGQELKKMICEKKYNGFWDTKNDKIFSNDCVTSDGIINLEKDDKKSFCNNVLLGDWNVAVLTTEAPLIVRLAKFLLRITMVLAITMVIFNGIMWIIESSKGAEVKDAKKNIVLLVVGILIALMSLGIINLITSLTVSSLGGGGNNISKSCIINGTVFAGDNLKKYICLHAPFGHNENTLPYREWNNNRIGAHCRFPDSAVKRNKNNKNGKWKSILNSEIIDKCIELGGIYNK